LATRKEVLFVIVGGLNTLIGFALFLVFHGLIGDRLTYQFTLVPTYAVGTLIAFGTQRWMVFRVRGQVLGDLARFTGVQACALALNAVVLTLLTETLDLPVVLGQAVSLAVVVIASYFAHLLFTFRRS
jgi:putative flippase GtrA